MTEIIDHAHFGILIVESLRIVSYPNVCNVELSTGTNIATRLRYVYKKFRPIPTYGFGFYPVPVAVTILNAIHTIFRPKSACQFQILTLKTWRYAPSFDTPKCRQFAKFSPRRDSGRNLDRVRVRVPDITSQLLCHSLASTSNAC